MRLNNRPAENNRYLNRFSGVKNYLYIHAKVIKTITTKPQAAMFTDDTEFIVKESKRLNTVFGIILFVLSAAVLYNIIKDYHTDQVPTYEKMLGLTLIPAVIFTIRGNVNKTLFRINKTGIYRYNELLTLWSRFIQARITQEAITGSFTDNFILLVEFCKEQQPGTFVRKMKLPNTMDKSEEEIIEAIRYFSRFSGYPDSVSSENREV